MSMRSSKRFAVTTGLTGLAVASGTLLLGQVPPATAPTTLPSTLPGTAPAVPTAPIAPLPPTAPMQPFTSTTRSTTRPATTTMRLQFSDAPVDAVLNHFSDAAGLIILKPGPVEGRVTLIAQQPVTVEEAIDLLNTVLRGVGGGFGAVRQEKVLKVVPLEQLKKENIPVYFTNDPDDPNLRENDATITVGIPIRNVDAVKLRQDLASLISINADVAANAGSNTIIITDRSSAIKRLVKIISTIDKAIDKQSKIETIKLKNATASTMAKLVQSLFPQTNAQGGNRQGGQGGVPGGQGFPGGFGGFGNNGGGGGGRGNRGGGSGGAAGGATGADSSKQGTVTASSDDRTNSLLLVGPVDTVNSVSELVKALDNQTENVLIKVMTLKNADAATSAKTVNSVFSSTSLGGGGSGGGGGGGGGSGGSTSYQSGRVNAVADDRTNSIIITAPSLAMPGVVTMIEELDKNPVGEQAFFIYPLRNAQSANIESVLNTLFGNGSTGSSGSRGTTSSRGTTTSSRGGTSSSGFGGGSSGSTSRAGGTGSGRSRGTTTTGGSNGFGGSQLSGRSQQAASDMSGQVFVVADTDTNSILVTVSARYADPVKQIIAELDRPVPQVLIKVLVAEVTHDDGVDLGLDFSYKNLRANGQGIGISSAFANSSLTTGLVVGVLEDKINAQLHLAATRGKLDVLSRPYILASDNQPASITVGNSVPFITNTRITDTGQQINTIQYQDIGIILNVTPHINPDGLVIMDVTPEVSQLGGTTVPIGNGVNAPVILTRSADSRVGVRSGQTIVIGGLMEDRKTATIEKIPLIGDIPLLGALFSRTQVTKSKTELLFFITPQVAQQPDLLQEPTDATKRELEITPGAVSKGKFDQHLKNMSQGAMPLTQPANPKEPSRTIPIPPLVPRNPSTGTDIQANPQGQGGGGQQFNPGNGGGGGGGGGDN